MGSNAMPQSGLAKLYTPEILALAVELSKYPLRDGFALRGEARSRSCGSSLEFGCDIGEGGSIREFGLRVTACAIGQAAAALFARDVGGRTTSDLARTAEAVEAWLIGSAPIPLWKGLDTLRPAIAHPGRHGAILLPWKAALAALSKPEAPR